MDTSFNINRIIHWNCFLLFLEISAALLEQAEVTYSADGVNENTIAFYNPVCYAYSHRRASSSSFIFKWHFAKNIP